MLKKKINIFGFLLKIFIFVLFMIFLNDDLVFTYIFILLSLKVVVFYNKVIVNKADYRFLLYYCILNLKF